MSSELTPKLQKIEVETKKLILDPNNPRLTTRKEDQFEEADFLDLDLTGTTERKMRDPSGKDKYKIQEIENSIRQNGWLPVDFIFVRKHNDGDHYVVLEGNRRVTAIRSLLDNEELDQKIRNSIMKIDVMEIMDDLPKAELDRKISYLLGVRHHGYLVKWTPFAQAQNIFKRYTELAKQNIETFVWKPDIGEAVANALSVSLKEVEERLKVYRAMWHLGQFPEIKNSPGGIRDRYYSVCAGLILRKNSKLNDYIKQDPLTFLLEDDGLERFNNLCHFSEPNRDNSPIKNPQEWPKLENILKDQDEERRMQMLEDVEVSKIQPSIVWAKRSAELQKLQWDKWLFQVTNIFKSITMGDDLTSDNAKATVSRLVSLIEKLEERDISGGINDA